MMRALRTVALICGLGAGGAALAQEVTPAPTAVVRCEIEGMVSGLVVRARSPRRRVTLDGVVASIAPLRRGLSAVSATLADGTFVEGTVRHAIPFEIAASTALLGGALTARPGASVLDVEPVAGMEAAELDVILDEGVVARDVRCGCDALRPTGGAPSAPFVSPSRSAAIPRWRPRVHDLHLRSGDAPERGEDLHLEVLDATMTLYEVRRHRDWVRVEASLPGGDVAGWTRDTDLAPSP